METTAGERAEENEEPRAEGAASQPCRPNLCVRMEREPENLQKAARPQSGAAVLAAVGNRRRDLPIVAPRGCR